MSHAVEQLRKQTPAIPSADEARKQAKVREGLCECLACPFGGPKVGTRGNPKARLVIVAEAPGSQEIASGIPLYGPSGKVFWSTLPKQLQDWGLSPQDDIYVLNALQCVPPRTKDAKKNTAALELGAKACNDRLMQLINAHPRDLIVTMGNVATHSVTGNYGYKITQIRGKLIPSSLSKHGILPLVHPAALLRGTGNYRQFKMDLHYAVDLLRGLPPKAPQLLEEIRVVSSELDFWRMFKELVNAPYIGSDIETTGFNRITDHVLCIGFSADPKVVWVVPDKYLHLLGPLFRRARGKFIWHNGKFDISFLRRLPGLGKARVDEDTMLLSYTYDEQGGVHDLEQVAGDLIGAPDYKAMLKPYLPNRKTSYANIPRDVLYKYMALDVSNTLQMFHILRRWVADDENMERAYTKVLLPASEMLYQVETAGIGVDRETIEENRVRLSAVIDEAVQKFNQRVLDRGFEEVNIASPQQLAALLFDKLRLKPPRMGNRSTDEDTLDRLPQSDIVLAIKAFRKAAKALSTYVVSIENAIQIDGRIHSTYLLHGTKTGRLSSRQPNMQNIPRDKRIRRQFRARPGHVFVKVDLNQAELRSLALFSQDDYLCEVYTSNNRSLHRETAEDFFPGWGRLNDPVTKDEQLMRAKAVNFGIVYGREAASLAEEFPGISPTEAQRWIDAWFKRSPKARAFILSCRQAALKGLTILTPFGRKKRHHLITQENLKAMQNEASNFVHQSVASDICLLGAIKAWPALRALKVLPVNLVHDEFMVECPDVPEVIDKVKKIITESMESIPVEWGLTRIPFKAEADVGERWGEYRKAA